MTKIQLSSTVPTVISIVPRLPPAIDGVGDYALNLARQLRKDFNIQTQFIVGDPKWDGASEIEGFLVSKVSNRFSQELLNVLSKNSSSHLLLHYVCYGYAKRGCPIWLVDGLQQWKGLYPQRSLVTMFHELYSSGSPPWNSSFWLSPIQKKLTIDLVELSDHHITSKKSYADNLAQITPGKQLNILSLPVFSNIGEPESPPLLINRTKRAVIFGHKHARQEIYRHHIRELEEICQRMNIEEVCDIGVSTGLELSSLIAIPIVEKGVAQPNEISDIMVDSLVGFLKYSPPTHLAKSTIFASYCAHRLLPCTIAPSIADIDGLQAGKDYYFTQNNDNRLSIYEAQEIADRAYHWYCGHNLSKQAQYYSALLTQ